MAMAGAAARSLAVVRTPAVAHTLAVAHVLALAPTLAAVGTMVAGAGWVAERAMECTTLAPGLTFAAERTPADECSPHAAGRKSDAVAGNRRLAAAHRTTAAVHRLVGAVVGRPLVGRPVMDRLAVGRLAVGRLAACGIAARTTVAAVGRVGAAACRVDSCMVGRRSRPSAG